MFGEQERFTRGSGLLEPLLARLRAHQADRLIPPSLRAGRILDIGCGTYPYFLAHTSFQEKHAIDQLPLFEDVTPREIQWHTLNLNSIQTLPYENEQLHVITLLAVIEHLDPDRVEALFREIYRVLAPSGVVIVTTPAVWADGLLRLMAHLGLVSSEEIHEHAYAYTLPLLGWYFGRAGFDMKEVRFGYFEFWMNMWAIAKKSGSSGNRVDRIID